MSGSLALSDPVRTLDTAISLLSSSDMAGSRREATG